MEVVLFFYLHFVPGSTPYELKDFIKRTLTTGKRYKDFLFSFVIPLCSQLIKLCEQVFITSFSFF